MKKIILKCGGDGTNEKIGSLTFGGGTLNLLWIVLFSVLYLIRDLGGVIFPDVVFSGLCAVIFLFANMGTSIGLYIFTTALTVPHNEICIFYVLATLFKLYLEKKLHFKGTLFFATVGMLAIQLLNTALFSDMSFAPYMYDYAVRMLPMLLPLLWVRIYLRG